MDTAENELITRVGPGTAGGETLRKYWLPVGLSNEIDATAPNLVRWLGEALLLFRDEFGRVGLTEPSCPHRGTSLDYGWIEAGGTRCCYHGWVFDVTGRCLEQPGEPADSNFKDKIRLKAYPVRELGGMIWAYMGQGDPPVLPNYHFLVRDEKGQKPGRSGIARLPMVAGQASLQRSGTKISVSQCCLGTIRADFLQHTVGPA